MKIIVSFWIIILLAIFSKNYPLVSLSFILIALTVGIYVAYKEFKYEEPTKWLHDYAKKERRRLIDEVNNEWKNK